MLSCKLFTNKICCPTNFEKKIKKLSDVGRALGFLMLWTHVRMQITTARIVAASLEHINRSL